MICAAVLGLIIWLGFWLYFWRYPDSYYYIGSHVPIGLLFILLIITPIIALIIALADGFKGSAIATKTLPNEGIYLTARNAVIIGLIIGLISGLILELLVVVNHQKIDINNMIGNLIIGLFFGLIALIFGGGKACIQHFTLRLILYRNGYIPWNYSRFLDYATERIFLQKVGGGYIFIHRLLLEHFAQMELESMRR